MKTFKLFLLSFIIILLLLESAYSGMLYDIYCTTKNCEFKIHLQKGRNMDAPEPITIFCCNCISIYSFFNNSQYINNNDRYHIKDKIKSPKYIGKIWSFFDNETIEVYNCPVCNNICNVINIPEKLKFCPKCKNQTLVTRRAGVSD